jgi:hypothetical protein
MEIIPEEFPTISDTYGQLGQQDAMSNEENCIECPFCGYLSRNFAKRCPGCG